MAIDLVQSRGCMNKIEHTKDKETGKVEPGKQQAELIHNEKLKALGIMSAGLAHEINNPLNYAVLGIELLKREGREMLAPEFDSIVSDVEDGLLRIKNIVQDLKIYARKTPDIDSTLETFLVGDAVAAAVRIVSPHTSHIEVSTMLNTPYRVYGDVSSIVQVLINLVSNAADAILRKQEARDGRIDILGKTVGDRYIIEVTDNGEGVSTKQIEDMFTPFYTTKSTHSGTGLGLSICQAIIERHGGEINVESILGSWTAVSFDLGLATA